MTSNQPRRNLAVLIPAIIVAAGAVAATAHGAFEVAVAAHVPPGIAWLYPVILDGLALVAYASTHRLTRAGVVYAWAVVIAAAGLSGLAQAAYLASGPALDTSPILRFGVGAWPAIAGAVAAHLVYLLSSVKHDAAESPVGRNVPSSAPPVQPPAHEERAEPERVAEHVARRHLEAVPAEKKTPTANATADESDEALRDRARELVADGAGYPTLIKQLGISSPKARKWAKELKAERARA